MTDASDLLAQTKEILKRYRLHARKGLGQHFLIDPIVLNSSIEAAELKADDIVVEVGPGLGVLTQELAKSVNNVIAIEIDPQIAQVLTKRFSHLQNVTILNSDVLQYFPENYILSNSNIQIAKYKVVANLPYYVAAAAIRHFLEMNTKPVTMVVMVQKEVADSMIASPGKMSLLSVGVQLYGKPTIVSYVKPQSFYPAPKVHSAIVHIDVYQKPIVPVEIGKFFEVVRAGFAAPRKQIRNSLALGLSISTESSAELLNRSKIIPTRRAETLDLEEWAELYRIVASTNYGTD